MGLVIVGGGFAGVWAAVAAARLRRDAGLGIDDISIAVVAPGPDLIIRPRLYEPEPDGMRVPLSSCLGPIDVGHVPGFVTDIDLGSRALTVREPSGRTRRLSYQRLVVATGSQLVRPAIPGAELGHDVDTIEAASRLEAHLRSLPDAPAGPDRFSAVVIGAGFVGIEVAAELVGRLRALAGGTDRPSVVVVERSPVVGPGLGSGPRPHIEAALAVLGVTVRTSVSVATITDDGVILSAGERLEARTVVWASGMAANPLAQRLPGEKDNLGRLLVDEHLRLPAARDVFSAGDVAAAEAEPGRRTLLSCQHAIPMGSTAGANGMADLLGLPPGAFAPPRYVTCVDLGTAGAVLTTGWDRAVAATGAEGKHVKNRINRTLIYPPTA